MTLQARVWRIGLLRYKEPPAALLLCCLGISHMLTLYTDAVGTPRVRQEHTSPALYLDNWALMDFAEHQEWAHQFRQILQRRHGTLYLSMMNFLELSEITDTTQLNAIESFLASLSPNLGFIEVNPGHVMAQEHRFLQGQRLDPACDRRLLQYYVDCPRDTLDPLTPYGFLAVLRRPRIIEICQTFMAPGDLLTKYEELRQQSREDPHFLKRPAKIPTGMSIPWATYYIFREAVCLLIRDNIDLSNSNHWRDLLHMVVPIAYCDFVLLDRAWATKARQVIARINNPDHPIKTASIFSSRELADFWTAFDEDGAI